MWFRKNVRQVCDGGLGRLVMYLDTVACEISMPSLRSSPWNRGAPQSGFSRLMRRMRSRTSRPTVGRPPLRRRDVQVQKRRKPLRCQPTTVSGFTMTSTWRQFGRIRERITHNSRSADRLFDPVVWGLRRRRFLWYSESRRADPGRGTRQREQHHIFRTQIFPVSLPHRCRGDRRGLSVHRDNRRLLESIGNIPPAEAEAHYYVPIDESAMVARLKPNSLRQTRLGSTVSLPIHPTSRIPSNQAGQRFVGCRPTKHGVLRFGAVNACQ